MAQTDAKIVNEAKEQNSQIRNTVFLRIENIEIFPVRYKGT